MIKIKLNLLSIEELTELKNAIQTELNTRAVYQNQTLIYELFTQSVMTYVKNHKDRYNTIFKMELVKYLIEQLNIDSSAIDMLFLKMLDDSNYIIHQIPAREIEFLKIIIEKIN